nr:hypothetical protein [Tanacetum cinerariifolium]
MPSGYTFRSPLIIGSRPRAAHELPLLTMTANRVIEMEDPVAATDSLGVPSTIERSPLDFVDEAGASDQGAAAPEVPPPEDEPAASVPEVGQAEEVAATALFGATEGRKRGRDGADVNAPAKVLRKDHADPRPTGSTRGGKSLAAMELGMASARPAPVPESAFVSDPDPLSFADPPSRHLADIAQSSQGTAAVGDPDSENASFSSAVAMRSQLRLRFEQEAKLLRKFVAQVARRDKRTQAQEHEIKNLEALLEAEVGMKKAAEDKSVGLSLELEDMRARFSDLQRYEDNRVEQRCAVMDTRLDALSIDFDEELYPHMLTAIAGRRWVIGRGLHLAIMKCGESLELRQAFADVVSAGIAKGMSEGLRHGVKHGQAQLSLESIEAYDPEAEAKYVAALQALKDLNSSQLTIPVYPEVRDPMNLWACKEEMLLTDAIAANISCAEKKKKCRIVCRTHGVGSEHHARSDGVLCLVCSMRVFTNSQRLGDSIKDTESAATRVATRLHGGPSCTLRHPTPLLPHRGLPILVLAFHLLLRDWRHCCAHSWRSSNKSRFKRSSSSLFTTSTVAVRYVGIPISVGREEVLPPISYSPI